MVTVTMVDIEGKISFSKYDIVTGKNIKDATYRIFSIEKGNKEVEVTKFVTVEDVKGQKFDVNGAEIAKLLKEGKTYYVQEVSNPYGYEKDPNKYEFVMNGDKNTQQIQMLPQQPKVLYLSITKVDALDNGKRLEGAEFTVYKADGSIAKDIYGNDAIVKSNADGIALVKVYYDAYSSYYVKETNAPLGYRLNDEKFEIKPTESYEFAEENPIQITVQDHPHKLLVKTFIENPRQFIIISLIGFATLGIGAAAFIIFTKKKKKNEIKEEPKK